MPVPLSCDGLVEYVVYICFCTMLLKICGRYAGSAVFSPQAQLHTLPPGKAMMTGAVQNNMIMMVGMLIEIMTTFIRKVWRQTLAKTKTTQMTMTINNNSDHVPIITNC